MTTRVVDKIEKVLCAVSVLMALIPQWPHLGTNVPTALMPGMGCHSSCFWSLLQSPLSTLSA